MTFAACLPVILASEGGFVTDQGGNTNLGVTQRVLSVYLGRAATLAEVQALTPQTVAPLYQSLFYNAAHCNQCPNGVDLMVFDESVNEGQGHAIRHLQQALAITVDGAFGPKTLTALQAADPIDLIHAMHDANSAYYDSLASIYPEDEKGWHARNDRTMAAALAMV